MNIPLLLIGATARDLILRYAFDIQPKRATKDIDFGVAVNSLDEFEKLNSALCEKANFTIDGKREHRLKDLSAEIIVDLIPFGKLESPTGKITFRNKNEMITSGFTEAFATALDVKLAENFYIKIASPIGLALLKLVAWTDRNSNKDSQDFWLIVKNYLDLGNQDRLYSEMLELLEDENFDYIVAGARLLGRDMSKIFNHQTEEIIIAIFNSEKNLQKLGSEIYRMEGSFEATEFDKIINVLKSFAKGLNDQK